MGFWKFINRNASLFPAVERFALAALSVEKFICAYRSHEHDNDGEGNTCSVCVQLNLAHQVLDSLACIATTLIVTSASLAKKPEKIIPLFFFMPATLIALKVKSNT
jgi:hypothetical protein